MDALTLFQLETPVFDAQALQQRYRALLKKVHPDNYANDVEKAAANRICIQLGAAFSDLKDFAKQAELFYVRIFGALPTSTLDSDFLEEMMELRQTAHLPTIQNQYQALLQTVHHAIEQKSQSVLQDHIPKIRFYQQIMENPL